MYHFEMEPKGKKRLATVVYLLKSIIFHAFVRLFQHPVSRVSSYLKSSLCSSSAAMQKKKKKGFCLIHNTAEETTSAFFIQLYLGFM